MKKSESQVIKDCRKILDLLRCHRILEYRKIHVPYGIKPTDMQKSQDMQGMPDMQIYLSGGKTLNIEFKSSTGKQRECQKVWEKDLKDLGHHYHVVTSDDELTQVLLLHGVDKTKYTWQNFKTVLQPRHF
jgi:hypothetical protein